jgi:hypothetical protein
MRTKILSRNLKPGDHSENPGIDGKIVLKQILGKQIEKVLSGFMWLMIGTRFGLLWIR